MTDQEINIAIAEYCGYSNFRPCYKDESGKKVCYGVMADYPAQTKTMPWIPHYTEDLNAMHEAEKNIRPKSIGGDWGLWERYVEILGDQFTGSEDVAFADAGERAEAYLRTIGKWLQS